MKVKLQLVSHLVFQNCFFQIGIYFKTLLKAKGRIHSGGFYLVKGKAFKTGGGISNLKNASCNCIHIPLTICKRFFEKEFPKHCKTKQVVQAWSKILNKKKIIPYISSRNKYWSHSKQPLHLHYAN